MQAMLILTLFTQQPYQTNPVKIVTTATFDLYRAIVSPSQGDVCNFSPSCSHFATEAIEEHGILWGSFMATDRLRTTHNQRGVIPNFNTDHQKRHCSYFRYH